MKRSYELLAIQEAYEDQFLSTEASLLDKLAMGGASEDEPEISRLLQVQDGVGLIEIRGMLTNVNSWLNRYFGLVSYDEIREATAQALEKEVGGIMYLIASPGGRVAGMNGAAELISSLPVPTLAYAEEKMASAALFLGIQADHVVAGDFAEVGSVGIVATVMDYSEQLKKAGVSAVRFRSGDLKQVGHPAFKMTDKEKKYMQEQVDLYANKFFDIVTDARGIPRPMLESLEITSGRTFIGQQALSVGLVDSIASFDQAFLKIAGLAKKNIDSRNKGTVRYGSL